MHHHRITSHIQAGANGGSIQRNRSVKISGTPMSGRPPVKLRHLHLSKSSVKATVKMTNGVSARGQPKTLQLPPTLPTRALN